MQLDPLTQRRGLIVQLSHVEPQGFDRGHMDRAELMCKRKRGAGGSFVGSRVGVTCLCVLLFEFCLPGDFGTVRRYVSGGDCLRRRFKATHVDVDEALLLW